MKQNQDGIFKFITFKDRSLFYRQRKTFKSKIKIQLDLTNRMYKSVHASLFPRWHHQIIYTNVNSNFFYPPAYEKLVWNYSKANITNI